MSPLNTNDLNQIFEKLDRNGDGFVSLNELKWFLQKIGVQTSLDEFESLLGKTSLDLLDFLFFYDTIVMRNINGDQSKGVEENKDLESDLARAFKVYDLNGDGFISCEELQIVLSQLGLWNEHCGRDGKSMVKVYDTNSDGVLDFEEFKNMMLLTTS
ncbi:putative calcium-binding protein CML44 [Camellia lanceoleosa]|uniref:Calcium-binding protein CML44 n=1 Tax=Camellia lanceoleosa TaxID=1840588 RepID=A0ACC0HQZ1_9ERIC|nr:putative calcium-binding protein CML44 [Camellia lanceoleosa]